MCSIFFARFSKNILYRPNVPREVIIDIFISDVRIKLNIVTKI